MKTSILLFCAATAQGAVLWWPGQHHAPGQPCGHHQLQQHHQQGAVHENVNQSGPFSFRIPVLRHIRIFWHSASPRPLFPSPAEIVNQVFDNDDDNHDVTPQPAAETETTVQPEEKNGNEITILPYTGHLDAEEVDKAVEEVKKEDINDVNEEEAHEDLRRIKQKRQFPGQFHTHGSNNNPFRFPHITAGSIPLYGQCDGIDFHGPYQDCELGSYCRFKDEYYSQCVPLPTPFGFVPRYGQCGGRNYFGSPFCVLGTECKFQNEFYSQCLP